ncbi:hypothetical protein PL321_03430 [Caloramator sp. mosi_1]|uniref:hypothetical protein n=1 Tax=Caloramator sp. mosi_1 TaxID=3023090 RepID=UPI0023631609|nr:hypothetical protein [Caloramator sp. mosi_1]WDC84725.1 hypothetical protein PL321_03430 [Caloramator sp. mosi_1]
MYKEAPWSLKGDGYIILYKFNKQFIKSHLYSQDFLKDNSCGGLGCVMIVDYKQSDVGPYRELLLFQANLSLKAKTKYNIKNICNNTGQCNKWSKKLGYTKGICRLQYKKYCRFNSYRIFKGRRAYF